MGIISRGRSLKVERINWMHALLSFSNCCYEYKLVFLGIHLTSSWRTSFCISLTVYSRASKSNTGFLKHFLNQPLCVIQGNTLVIREVCGILGFSISLTKTHTHTLFLQRMLGNSIHKITFIVNPTS